MPLYKYVCPERTDILESGMIRFTQQKYLNDYFDIKVDLRRLFCEEDNKKVKSYYIENTNVTEQLNKITNIPVDIISQNIHKSFIDFENPSPFFKEIQKIIIYELINDTFGIFCLTTTPKNKRMWAHYAYNSKGFVIEFDNEHLYFNNGIINDPDFGKLRKVDYSYEPIIVDNIRDKRMFNAFYTKDKIWEDEGEWRIIFPINKADKTIYKNGEVIKLFKFPPDLITRIIFGLRTENSTIEIIKDLCTQERYKHVQLQQIIAEETTYEMDVDNYK